jgi:hypothetical protein
MFLKLMNGDDLYELIGNVRKCSFEQVDGAHFVRITLQDWSVIHHQLTGAAFVMNDEGKTVERFVAPVT